MSKGQKGGNGIVIPTGTIATLGQKCEAMYPIKKVRLSSTSTSPGQEAASPSGSSPTHKVNLDLALLSEPLGFLSKVSGLDDYS